MVKIIRRKEKVLAFVLKLTLLVVPQIFGVLVFGWDWRLMMVQFFLQLVILFIIDIIIISSKPRRLYDDPVKKSLLVKRQLFISILLWPLGIGIIELAYGSNPYYIPRVEFFEQYLPGMLMVSLGFLLVNLVAAWTHNKDTKMSETDVGQKWLPMMISLFFAIILAVTLDNNKIYIAENTLWVFLLIAQIVIEICYFIWRNNPKNQTSRHFG